MCNILHKLIYNFILAFLLSHMYKIEMFHCISCRYKSSEKGKDQHYENANGDFQAKEIATSHLYDECKPLHTCKKKSNK